MPEASPLPTFSPLPLVRWRDPFDHPYWLYELKLDGFRALAYVADGQVRLVSRTGYTYKAYAALCAELPKAVRATSSVLHGEIVCRR